MTTADIIMNGGGTIYTLFGNTPAGTDWLTDNLPEDAMMFGNAYVVEHRYVGDIIDGAMNDGMTVQ